MTNDAANFVCIRHDDRLKGDDDDGLDHREDDDH
jgi:hypothetical protein